MPKDGQVWCSTSDTATICSSVLLMASSPIWWLVADALTPLRESLGEQASRGTMLPAGASGQPSPLLSVDSFLFSATASEEQTDLALKFAQFAASETNQILFAQEANMIPTNRSAAASIGDPATKHLCQTGCGYGRSTATGDSGRSSKSGRKSVQISARRWLEPGTGRYRVDEIRREGISHLREVFPCLKTIY